jgi:hypothetical protein
MEPFLTLNNFVISFAHQLANGIEDSQLDDIAAPGMNSPRWIYGHLVVAANMGLQVLGKPLECPESWMKAFGPGSDPATPPNPAPDRAELLRRFDASHAALREAVKALTPEQRASPSSFAKAAKLIPTLGDLLGHLLTTHAMLHLGQLSAWRRLRGLPPVLGF